MSRPLPHDPSAAAAEQARQDDLRASGAYQRGILQAQAQEKMNAQHALNQGLADLARVSLNRDASVAGRDFYDRKHRSVVKAAERLASILEGSIVDGKVIEGAVSVPAWLPPPVPTRVDTIIVRAPRPSTSYAERAGLSPDGKGLPLTGPGSNTDPNWMETK